MHINLQVCPEKRKETLYRWEHENSTTLLNAMSRDSRLHSSVFGNDRHIWVSELLACTTEDQLLNKIKFLFHDKGELVTVKICQEYDSRFDKYFRFVYLWFFKNT